MYRYISKGLLLTMYVLTCIYIDIYQGLMPKRGWCIYSNEVNYKCYEFYQMISFAVECWAVYIIS